MIKVNVLLTLSKIAGIICILLSIPFICIGQPQHAILSMLIGSGLIGVKTITQKFKSVINNLLI